MLFWTEWFDSIEKGRKKQGRQGLSGEMSGPQPLSRLHSVGLELLDLDLGNQILQCRSCLEANILRCLDLDRFAGRRVAAGTGSALGHGKCAEIREGETSFFLEVAANKAKDLFNDLFCLDLSDFMVGRDLVNDLALVH